MSKEKAIEFINRAKQKVRRIDTDNCYSLSMDIESLLKLALKELEEE